MKGMTILLTGGAGFIGSHLAERLLREGRRLVVVDDLNDFYSPDWKRANLETVRRVGRFDFHHCDIRDTGQTARLIAETGPDAVIHLAARAGVRPSLEQPLLYEEVNVHATLGLLEACRRHKTPKFLFASSSSIYGVANQVPFREDDFHNLPISPYAATKLAGEKICYTYSHLYAIQVLCLRFFTVYGPRQRPDLAIRKFTDMIDRGVPVPVFGDGSSGRDYTFIDDTVSGIMAALSYEAPYEIFNLGNSHPVTLERMISTLEEKLGKKAILERLADQPGDVPITYADIGKARRLLGYNPQTPFPEGIEKFIRWFREFRNGRIS
jgi:UDP-glucuronate 4-epimerase